MAWHTPVWHWLAQAALAGLVILAAGCLAVGLCRQPVRRLRLMELTLLGCLLAPVLSLAPALPHLSLGVLESPHATPAADESVIAEEPVAAAVPALPALPMRPVQRPTRPVAVKTPAVSSTKPPLPDTAAEPTPAAVPLPPLPVLAGLAYAAVMAFFVLRWLAGVAQLLRLRSSAGPVPTSVASLFAEMAGPAAERVRLLASDRIELPLTFGWRRPVIVVPARLCAAGEERVLRCCLAHEWSHVERRDMRAWHLATLAQLLFFYQPLLWWLRRQLRLCQDYLADARAAAEAASAEDYASYLVLLAGRRLCPAVTAGLAFADRRSNLYRRILMLVHNREALERRCPRAWNAAITVAAAALLAAVAGLRLDAADSPEATKAAPAKGHQKAPAEVVKGKTLTYTGRVYDKKTGKGIAGAVVTVRRSVYTDPKTGTNKVVQETKHKTDAKGKYTFTIPPEQSAEPRLYIELDVNHPYYAAKTGFGYALSMILKNEKMGDRPFFESIDLNPAKAVTGTVQTPDGKPAANIQVLTFSVPDGEFMGSFGRYRTDKQGRFRVMLATPGEGVFWLMPDKYAPSMHVMNRKRGDMGIFGLQKGVVLRGKVLDAKGRPAAGAFVEARRERQEGDDDFLGRHAVADAIGRHAKANSQGEFEMAPLPGVYRVEPTEHFWDSNTRKQDHRPLPGVYFAENVTLKEGQPSDPVELVAVPTVTIEAQYLDSKGKPHSGHEIMLFGRRGKNNYWFGQGQPDAKGHILAKAPLGLTDVEIQLMTNEHSSLRYRLSNKSPLSNLHDIKMKALKNDLRGIQIVRYEAPILIFKLKAADKAKLKNAAMTADYAEGRGPYQPRLLPVNGRPSDVFFEKQEDGRFRTEQLLPDEEVTVTAYADGYQSRPQKFKLPEKAVKEVEITLEKVSEPVKKDKNKKK